ncbi:hypothetical protein AGR7C_Lc190015 [Agrobacterium deltaense Zutra 3/1]|uniref:Uncharacterized protein n=1 Tax=Agrobacterium deltaense Zutra 3/1 TaxID=1183427 RepID=A0A1S7RJ89_9HYPH|nr:hypothetical protein AGR7C_Lc190015 [Agrobacterium deltaense Zutra 3/1]
MQKRADQLLVVEELRERLERIGNGPERLHETLPFGVDAIDHHLPGGGLKLGCLHELSGGGNGAADGAAAALFAAGVAARLSGKVFMVCHPAGSVHAGPDAGRPVAEPAHHR